MTSSQTFKTPTGVTLNRVKLENIWLNGKSQSQKATYYIIHKMFRIGNYIDLESDCSGWGWGVKPIRC